MKRLICLFCVISFLFCGCDKTEPAGKGITEFIEENRNCSYGIYELNITKKLLSNNAVGNDWSFKFFLNEEEIKNGHEIIYSLELFQFITIEAEITEKDKINDVGTGKITLGLCDEGRGKAEIIVIENAGRFKGNKAIWEITCELKMIGKK